MKRVVLFDLDDTLLVEEPAAVAAFLATAQLAGSSHKVEVERLAIAARSRARELWRAAPSHSYCTRVGISSWEGLWCRFEGEDPTLRWLREWSPVYRREAWRLALADQGVEDMELAGQLGDLFGVERRRRHALFADVLACLKELGDTYTFGLITNGASCLQREKLTASGLGEHFEVVVISAEFGIGKPNSRIFEYALWRLGAKGEHAVMVGDSITRDVEGAIAAGLRGVWINRGGESRPDDRRDLVEISTLTDLSAALTSMK